MRGGGVLLNRRSHDYTFFFRHDQASSLDRQIDERILHKLCYSNDVFVCRTFIFVAGSHAPFGPHLYFRHRTDATARIDDAKLIDRVAGPMWPQYVVASKYRRALTYSSVVSSSCASRRGQSTLVLPWRTDSAGNVRIDLFRKTRKMRCHKG